MNILNIFHTGGITLALTALWLLGVGVFGYQAFKAHNSGWQQDTLTTGHTEGPDKISYWKIPQTWIAIVLTVLYIIAMISVASDYKGV